MPRRRSLSSHRSSDSHEGRRHIRKKRDEALETVKPGGGQRSPPPPPLPPPPLPPPLLLPLPLKALGECSHVNGYACSPSTADVSASENSPWSHRPCTLGFPCVSVSVCCSRKRRNCLQRLILCHASHHHFLEFRASQIQIFVSTAVAKTSRGFGLLRVVIPGQKF